jgi:AAHS family 4-hydroxybenzoate transporter-like MFS transporter
LPALLQQSGIPLKRAIIIASVFSLGGIAGGFVLGIGSKRRDPRLLMGLGFVAAAIWIAALGLSIGHVAFVVLAVFLTGFFVTGSKVVMWAVSAAAYRTAMRSTGVGWASAFGRVGSILGPLTGGFLLGTGATVSVLFYFTALPAVVGAVGSFLLARKPQESLVIASMKTD